MNKIMYRVFDNANMILLTHRAGDKLDNFVVPCEVIKETKNYIWVRLGDKLEKRNKKEFAKSKEEGLQIIVALLENLVEQGEKAREILREIKK